MLYVPGVAVTVAGNRCCGFNPGPCVLLGDGPDIAMMLTLCSEGSETPTTDLVAAATIPLSRRFAQSPGAMKEKEIHAKQMKVLMSQRIGSPSDNRKTCPFRWSASAHWWATLILGHHSVGVPLKVLLCGPMPVPQVVVSP